jgi:hypothetical protein
MTAAVMNRQTLSWRGLENAPRLIDALRPLSSSGSIPITWFIRVDRQLQQAYGSALYLLDRFASFWSEMLAAGHELAWHPHLYDGGSDIPVIAGPMAAASEIAVLGRELAAAGFHPSSFRNGEGWHSTETFNAVEDLGLCWDSTAIPGRLGPPGHPMVWSGVPNRPYFPSSTDIRVPGFRRRLLEVPMNTWMLQAPYDSAPRLRYINPAVHEALFESALQTLPLDCPGPHVWTLVLHPDEALTESPRDLLYSRSPETVFRNVQSFADALRSAGHTIRFATVSSAGQEWLELETLV